MDDWSYFKQNFFIPATATPIYIDISYMKKAFLIITILFKLDCCAQTYPLSDFSQISLPKPYSPEWYLLDTMKHPAFAVSIVKGKLRIENDVKKKYPFLTYYALPRGDLLAINTVEVGGWLTYIPRDTTLKYLFINGKKDTIGFKYADIKWGFPKLEDVQALFKSKRFIVHFGYIHLLFRYHSKLYFIENDYTGIGAFGVFYRLDVYKKGFKTTKLIDFNEDSLAKAQFKITGEIGYTDIPCVIKPLRKKIYMATNSRFYILDNWKKDIVFDHLFWDGLNPNSFALLKDILFVGMHGGYAKIDLKKRGVTFYKYDML
jgi:hypothetical protein